MSLGQQPIPVAPRLAVVPSLSSPAALFPVAGDVDLATWGDYGITPLWWEINTTVRFSGITAAASKVQSLIEEAQDSDDDLVYIPIRLKTGVERDRVIDAIVEQIQSIGDRLNRAFPADVR